MTTKGNIPNDDRNYIIQRATDSGVAFDKLALEPEHDPECITLCDDDPEGCRVGHHCWCTAGRSFLVSVMIGGALDSEWKLGDTLYAVNIVDWLAEYLRDDSDTGGAPFGGEPWEIILSDTEGNTLYRVES